VCVYVCMCVCTQLGLCVFIYLEQDIRKKYPPHDPSQCGIVWSENPDIPKWQVKLMLHSSEPEKVEERYGFVVLSTMEKISDDGSLKKIVKLNSQHHADSIDTEMFRKFLRKGLPFTKLELAGPFLNNVSICPAKYTVGSEVALVEVINLKYLVLKPKITLAIKGEEKSAQDTYVRIHKNFFQTMKARTAKNIWYILKSINGPRLETLQIQDFVEWEEKDDGEDVGDGIFRYWDQALCEFVERHSSSLRSVRVSPVPVSTNAEASGLRPIVEIPVLKELYFCPKISAHIPTPSHRAATATGGHVVTKNFESWLRHEHVGNQLHLWKEILGAQRNLNNIGWICDTWNPFPLNRKDFARLCENNPKVETLMLILHGDEKFRKELGGGEEEALPPLNLKDFQINCTIFHGLHFLKILTVGCCADDEQKRNFCMYNLGMLPKSLEAIHFSGLRIPDNELMTLKKLTKLKSLTIVEDEMLPKLGAGSATPQLAHQKEGLTEALIKSLLYMRSLEKLVVVGIKMPDFPSSQQSGKGSAAKQGIWNSDESTSQISQNESSFGSGIFSFFG